MNFKQSAVLVVWVITMICLVPLGVGATSVPDGGFTVSDRKLSVNPTLFSSGQVNSIDSKEYFSEIVVQRDAVVNDIQELGESFAGLGYVWGGETEEGFDCSGFMKYIYGKHEIFLPRTASEQYTYSGKITPNQAVKGDLVFFYGEGEDSDRIVHVGMYLGDGKFLQSGGPSNDVNTSEVNIYGKLIVFGRVI